MPHFFPTLLAVAALAVAGSAPAQSIHIAHCLAGCPGGTAASNEILVRNLFAVSVNQQTGLADWVSYRVMQGTIGVASLLPREWHADDLLDETLRSAPLPESEPRLRQPSLENQQDQAYRITEFTVNASDRGRLVPMSSFAATSYWRDLNYLSVMSPLKSAMRNGPWSRLDQSINLLAQSLGEVYVVAGPVYDAATSPQSALGENSFLPRAYFKVVADAAGRLSVFVFDQDLPPHASYCAQRSSLAELEQAVGLTLFPLATAWPSSSLDSELGCPSGE